MYGHSFCIAGKQAFKLLVDNALRVTVINSVGDFVLLLAKVFVVAATVLIGIELIKVLRTIRFLINYSYDFFCTCRIKRVCYICGYH